MFLYRSEKYIPTISYLGDRPIFFTLKVFDIGPCYIRHYDFGQSHIESLLYENYSLVHLYRDCGVDAEIVQARGGIATFYITPYAIVDIKSNRLIDFKLNKNNSTTP